MRNCKVIFLSELPEFMQLEIPSEGAEPFDFPIRYVTGCEKMGLYKRVQKMCRIREGESEDGQRCGEICEACHWLGWSEVLQTATLGEFLIQFLLVSFECKILSIYYELSR